MKQIYTDADLDPLDTAQWYPKLMRKDYNVGLNITEAKVDDPDLAFYENYVCGDNPSGSTCVNSQPGIIWFWSASVGSEGASARRREWRRHRLLAVGAGTGWSRNYGLAGFKRFRATPRRARSDRSSEPG